MELHIGDHVRILNDGDGETAASMHNEPGTIVGFGVLQNDVKYCEPHSVLYLVELDRAVWTPDNNLMVRIVAVPRGKLMPFEAKFSAS